MADLKNIVYLTDEQYSTLIAQGSITVNGTTLTYDPNNVYMTPDDSVDLTSNQTVGGTKTFTSNIIANDGIRTSSINGLSGTTTIQVGKNLIPSVNNDSDLGSSNRKWKDLYLAGDLTDGTNSVTVAHLASLQNYTLPQADGSNLGGIKADAKTNDDTQEVHIDSTTGKLYTRPGSTSITVVDALDSTSTIDALSANQGRVLDKKKTNQEVHIELEDEEDPSITTNIYHYIKTDEVDAGSTMMATTVGDEYEGQDMTAMSAVGTNAEEAVIASMAADQSEMSSFEVAKDSIIAQTVATDLQTDDVSGKAVIMDPSSIQFVDAASQATVLTITDELTTDADIKPANDDTNDLGDTTHRYKDVYVSGNLTDGTNSASVSEIISGISNAVTVNTEQTVVAEKVFTTRPSVSEPISLPSGYQALEYIEFATGQNNATAAVIDTGMTITETSKVYADFEVTAAPAILCVPFGAFDTNIDPMFGLLTSPTEMTYMIASSSNNDTLGGGYTAAFDTNRHQVLLENGEIKIDGFIHTFDKHPAGLTITNKMLIGSASDVKIYAFKIYSGSTLSANLVPAKRTSDDEIGLYDLVRSTFYANDTTAYPDGVISGSTLTANNTSPVATKKDLQDIAYAIEEQINDINDLIPAQATASNQLADKEFVNSSISTNTANFIGTFANVTALNAYSGTVTNNDYAFVENQVLSTDFVDTTALNAVDKTTLTNFDYAWVINGAKFDLYRFDIVNQQWVLKVSNTAKADVTLNSAYNRYKYVAENPVWLYEYTLNNSSFTATQWAAINSGITSDLVTQIGTNTTNIGTMSGNISDILADIALLKSQIPTVVKL